MTNVLEFKVTIKFSRPIRNPENVLNILEAVLGNAGSYLPEDEIGETEYVEVEDVNLPDIRTIWYS